MGQFSWMDCVSGEQIVDNRRRDVYLLVPKQFESKYGPRIQEHEYDGYGNFGKYDVYDLIAEWNKGMIPEIIRRAKAGNWVCSVDEEDEKVMMAFYEGKPLPEASGFKAEVRWIGIVMGCYDRDNEKLEYPIKITYSPTAVYENCDPSPSDPNQGWPDEPEDDYYADENDDTEDEESEEDT